MHCCASSCASRRTRLPERGGAASAPPLPNEKRPGLAPGPRYFWIARLALEVHPAARHGRRRFLLLRKLGDHRLGGDEEARHRRGVLDRGAYDLGRVDDALRHQIDVLAGLRVEAEAVLILL